jgi:hypothetical protein
MEGKTFYNSEWGKIQYDYISSYNTIGIIYENLVGVKFYFINVDINAYGSFAKLSGMATDSGWPAHNFEFKLFGSKVVMESNIVDNVVANEKVIFLLE